MPGRYWTIEEITYLQENWGTLSLPTLATTLNRSVKAIRCKVWSMGYDKWLNCGDYVTVQSINTAIYGEHCNRRRVYTWLRAGLPVIHKKVETSSFIVTTYPRFWAWAESHRSLINFAQLQPGALGAEPDWVAEQRKIDGKDVAKKNAHSRWTQREDDRLTFLLRQQKYTSLEIAAEMGRTARAIECRRVRLGIKDMPVDAFQKREFAERVWTDEMYETVEKAILSGESYVTAGARVGKSDLAVKCAIYKKYGFNALDKVRKALKEEQSWAC